MKKIIILIFIFNFLSNLNCFEDADNKIWFIDIENKLSYSIKVEFIFINKPKSTISDIQPNEIRTEWISTYYNYQNSGKKAHKRIKQISVYKESDNTLIMQLKDSEIDKYVIYTDENIYGGYSYQFLFQIKEEDFGVGVKKVTDFDDVDDIKDEPVDEGT